MDTLDLEAPALVDAVLPAPGAVHLAVQGMLLAALFAQGVNDVLHVLAARTVCH